MTKILLVGFCFPDAQRLYVELSTILKQEAKPLDNFAQLKDFLDKNKEVKVILINRAINIDKSNGFLILDFLKKNYPEIKVILISSVEEFQKSAIEKGAVLSFDLDLLINIVGEKREKEKQKIIEKLETIVEE